MVWLDISSWLLLITIAIAVVIGLSNWLAKRRLSAQAPLIYLELTPPLNTTKSTLATEHFFQMIHALGDLDRAISLEIVSDRHSGIRFLAGLSQSLQPVFIQQLSAYLPALKVKVVADYLPAALGRTLHLVEFKQAQSYIYPLADQDHLAQHDPVSFLTGAMTGLAASDIMAYQLVLMPYRYSWQVTLLKRLITGLYATLKLSIGLIAAIISAKPYRAPRQPDSQPTAAQQAISEEVADKLSQPLFRVAIRCLAVSDNPQTAKRGLLAMHTALQAGQRPGYQCLKAKVNILDRWRGDTRWFNTSGRQPTSRFRPDNILAVSEVASLFHLPYNLIGSPENLLRASSRSLPVSAELKAQADRQELAVTLGVNKHHGQETIIGLAAGERARHLYIVGGTGNGKTTMLTAAIIQDIKAGRGVAVIDPHGDLAETLLSYIPPERLADVIYFDPADLDYPLGLNLLELPSGLTPSQLALEQDFVTEAIISIFRKTFSAEDSGGHRVETMLRNAIRTAFTIPNATLLTLYDLFTDYEFRNRVVAKLTDKRLVQFWQAEYGQAGGMQRVKMASGVTNKLNRFDSSAVVKRVIGQIHSSLDFDDIINSGKILICQLAKGAIGEDTSELFGTIILTKLQLAALRRSRIAANQRRPFYLYVDEFQHFATASFLQILSEARKYQLFITMAEQSTAQQSEQRLVQIILDNVGTVVCFRVRAASESLLLPLFKPFLETGEIATLPAYHFYMRINGLASHEPLSGETLLLDEPGSREVSQQVKALSRATYGRVYVEPTVQKIKTSGQAKVTTKPQRRQDGNHVKSPKPINN